MCNENELARAESTGGVLNILETFNGVEKFKVNDEKKIYSETEQIHPHSLG